jgi:hypothetical protein
MMRRKTLCLSLALVLGLALASAASAQVAALGPDNPLNGFPKYVKDINGVKLDLPVPPIGQGATGDPLQVFTPPTMTFDAPIPTNPWSVATGFGAEAFFYLAQSTMEVAGGGRALLVMGVEAAYGAGDPRNAPPTNSSLPGSGSASTPPRWGPMS